MIRINALDLLTLQSLNPNAAIILQSLFILLAIWLSIRVFISEITTDLQLFKVSHLGLPALLLQYFSRSVEFRPKKH